MLLSMLMISAGSLAFLATPTASAFWCGPSLDPNTAIVQQTCDEALRTASGTVGPYYYGTVQPLVEQVEGLLP